MLQDWGVKSTATTHAQRLFELNEFLIDQHRQGLSPVLVIDEAQNLSLATLEAVRLLSNFETSSQKLMQILLVGQPELRDKLNTPELRQLKQRIGLRCHIGPLSPEETRLYIRHRLRIAGASDAGIFTDAAIQRITEYSEGIPRVVNIICDHCLLSGFADSKRRIDAGVVARRSNTSRRASVGSGSATARSGSFPAAVSWAARGGVAALVVLVLLLLVLPSTPLAGSAMRSHRRAP